MKRHTLFLFFIVIVILSTISSVFAKEITIFEQPAANSKVQGKIDTASGFIPIYVPVGQKEWIKIADPKNGNVGWAKQNDLNQASGTSYSSQQIIQRITNDGGKEIKNYQLIHTERQNKFNDRQVKGLLMKMKAHEEAMEKLFHDMMADFNFDLYYPRLRNNDTPNNAAHPETVTAPKKTSSL